MPRAPARWDLISLLRRLASPSRLRPIDFKTDEQRGAAFLALNPRGRVPVLLVDGVPVEEAPAVLLFLAALDPERRLLPPEGTVAFGTCLQWVMWITSSLHIAIAQVWRPDRFITDAVDKESFVASGLEKVGHHFREIEDGIAEPWIAGSQYTIADCYMLPFFRYGELLGFKMESDYPRLTSWKERMKERPTVQKALDQEGLTEWRLITA